MSLIKTSHRYKILPKINELGFTSILFLINYDNKILPENNNNHTIMFIYTYIWE